LNLECTAKSVFLKKKEEDIFPSGGAPKEQETTKAALEGNVKWSVYIIYLIGAWGKCRRIKVLPFFRCPPEKYNEIHPLLPIVRQS